MGKDHKQSEYWIFIFIIEFHKIHKMLFFPDKYYVEYQDGARLSIPSKWIRRVWNSGTLYPTKDFNKSLSSTRPFKRKLTVIVVLWYMEHYTAMIRFRHLFFCNLSYLQLSMSSAAYMFKKSSKCLSETVSVLWFCENDHFQCLYWMDLI